MQRRIYGTTSSQLPSFLWFLLPAVLLPVVLLPGGCRKPTATVVDIVHNWKLTPVPPRIGPANCVLVLRDRQGKPLTGAAVQLEGNMSHPGMQPVLAKMKEAAPGRYTAVINFTMGGDWFILADATLPDGRRWHQKIDVPSVRSE